MYKQQAAQGAGAQGTSSAGADAQGAGPDMSNSGAASGKADDVDYEVVDDDK